MNAPDRDLFVRGGTLVTMAAAEEREAVVVADLLVCGGRIAAIGPSLAEPPGIPVIEARGMHVLPGFIQGHVHLGQALFRGLAEGRELMDWLRERVWPLEAAHDHDSVHASGMLGALDCLRSGTTTIHDIGLVTDIDALFEAIAEAGLRAVAGKCLMDTGLGVPPRLLETPQAALLETRELYGRWHGSHNGRITYALCPRFILSCSEPLWEGVVELASELGVPVHTHLLEHAREEAEAREVLGEGQMSYLDRLGVLDTDLRIAHGVQFGPEHRDLLDGRSLTIAHCPSANLKLGSGIADLGYLRTTAGVHLAIGCDGAPCNNDMDVLEEIRLAALLQGYRQGPGKFSAEDALRLATSEGARALGMSDRIGSLEVGKAADLVVLDLERPASFGAPPVSVYDRIVYGAARDAVRDVVVDGHVRIRGGVFCDIDESEVLGRATEAIEQVCRRARLT